MRFIFLFISLIVGSFISFGQETVYPAPQQKESIAVTNATIHVGNGQVIEKGTVVFDKGKIIYVGNSGGQPSAAKTIDAAGKHVYPGLILAHTDLGLREVAAGTRATNDHRELGEINPNVRSIVAYNTDSKIINTLRSNGILLAHVVPQGGVITGTSSVVQLDAWNWEDASYHRDGGSHFDMPSLIRRVVPSQGSGQQSRQDPIKAALDRVEEVKNFLRQAKAYAHDKQPATNLKYEAVKGLFDRKKKLFIHCNAVKEMLVAIDMAEEFGFDAVIVGGSESWQIADLLKQKNIGVILAQMHSLPTAVDDDIDQPFKTPAALQKAGVLFAINDNDGQTRGRNLMFNAGTAAAYGLSKEEALSAVTLNAAKILGIADRTGSIETGKDANIVISTGDLLDMKSSVVTNAFIQGRTIDLTDKHKQLSDRYEYKYGLK
jgi:imidazolonepropionase-like amidohydrolase